MYTKVVMMYTKVGGANKRAPRRPVQYTRGQPLTVVDQLNQRAAIEQVKGWSGCGYCTYRLWQQKRHLDNIHHLNSHHHDHYSHHHDHHSHHHDHHSHRHDHQYHHSDHQLSSHNRRRSHLLARYCAVSCQWACQ